MSVVWGYQGKLGCCVQKLVLEKRMQSQPTGFAISHCIRGSVGWERSIGII